MITGYETFGLYQAIKLHFTTDSYDFFKYGGKSKISVDAFENRKDKYYFYKLSRRLSSKDELISFLVANFVQDENCWVGNLLEESSDIIYRERQKVQQGISYHFQNDCDKVFDSVFNPNEVIKVVNGEYPILLTMALRKEIEIETLCILNKLLQFFGHWSPNISDTIRWPEYRRKVLKYSPFIQFDENKCRNILKKVIHEKVENIS
jgi:hypothetical protein